MLRDVKFLSWHIQYAEIDDADDCDCTLGVVWDVSESWEQAERLIWRVMKFRERGVNAETEGNMRAVQGDEDRAGQPVDRVSVPVEGGV